MLFARLWFYKYSSLIHCDQVCVSFFNRIQQNVYICLQYTTSPNGFKDITALSPEVQLRRKSICGCVSQWLGARRVVIIIKEVCKPYFTCSVFTPDFIQAQSDGVNKSLRNETVSLHWRADQLFFLGECVWENQPNTSPFSAEMDSVVLQSVFRFTSVQSVVLFCSIVV